MADEVNCLLGILVITIVATLIMIMSFMVQIDKQNQYIDNLESVVTHYHIEKRARAGQNDNRSFEETKKDLFENSIYKQ